MSEADVLAPVKDLGGPQQPLLEVRALSKHFPVRSGFLGKAGVVRAVDDVSFSVDKGEVLGIVGESGCGKSTTARLVIGLIEPDAGSIVLDGEKLGDELSLRELRRDVQMVFQELVRLAQSAPHGGGFDRVRADRAWRLGERSPRARP